jgi:dynein heavy chain, axonemal
VKDLLKSKFKVNWNTKEIDFFNGPQQIIFSYILKLDAEDRLYEEITDKKKLFKTLEDKLSDYNITCSSQKMDLVFFDDAISHIIRISRILRQPRGNAMLIGVSGCGKQSLTRLCSAMLEAKCF